MIMKLTMAKSCNGEGDDTYMQGLYDNLSSLVTKANNGSGRGMGRSVFADDVPILVNISSEQKIDELLQIWRDEDKEKEEEDGGDSSSDEDDSDADEPSLEIILDAASDEFYKTYGESTTCKAIIKTVEEMLDISIDGQVRKTVKAHLVDLAAKEDTTVATITTSSCDEDDV